MDNFSRSNPDLINPDTLKPFEDILNKPPSTQMTGFNDSVGSFYDKYIEPNLLAIILLIIFGLFLYYKYITKGTEESFENEELLKNIKKKKSLYIGTGQIADTGKYGWKPHFNPYDSLENQKPYVNFMDNHVPFLSEKAFTDSLNPVPINVNGERTTFHKYNQLKDNIVEAPKDFPYVDKRILYEPDYTQNVYAQPNEFEFPHPYDWENNELETTSNAVNFTNSMNKKTMDEYNQSIQDMNKQLLSNLNL